MTNKPKRVHEPLIHLTRRLNVSPIYILIVVLVLGFSVTYYRERWKR